MLNAVSLAVQCSQRTRPIAAAFESPNERQTPVRMVRVVGIVDDKLPQMLVAVEVDEFYGQAPP